MPKLFRRFLADEAGAAAIEYGLIASLIALALLGAWTALGGDLSERFFDIGAKVQQ
jgi:pilus assembly protein Flp/PilA